MKQNNGIQLPSGISQLKLKGIVTTVDCEHQCFILFSCDFVFNEEAAVFCLQPETESKTHVKRWDVSEWHVAEVDAGKMDFVATSVKDSLNEKNVETKTNGLTKC